MEIRKLLGNRVYLEVPEEPTSNVILDDHSKRILEEERLKKWGRLRVYAVGEAAAEIVSVGDEVMVDPSSVSRSGGVIRIPISPDKDVLLVSVLDIAHIW